MPRVYWVVRAEDWKPSCQKFSYYAGQHASWKLRSDRGFFMSDGFSSRGDIPVFCLNRVGFGYESIFHSVKIDRNFHKISSSQVRCCPLKSCLLLFFLTLLHSVTIQKCTEYEWGYALKPFTNAVFSNCYIQLQIFYVLNGILRSDSYAASIHRILTLDALY